MGSSPSILISLLLCHRDNEIMVKNSKKRDILSPAVSRIIARFKQPCFLKPNKVRKHVNLPDYALLIIKISSLTFRLQFMIQLTHGTIIRTGITCKEIPCYMRNSASRWLIVENAKIFRSYLKYF